MGGEGRRGLGRGGGRLVLASCAGRCVEPEVRVDVGFARDRGVAVAVEGGSGMHGGAVGIHGARLKVERRCLWGAEQAHCSTLAEAIDVVAVVALVFAAGVVGDRNSFWTSRWGGGDDEVRATGQHWLGSGREQPCAKP